MTIIQKKSCDRGRDIHDKVAVGGSVADRPEGVLQNGRDNLGLTTVIPGAGHGAESLLTL